MGLQARRPRLGWEGEYVQGVAPPYFFFTSVPPLASSKAAEKRLDGCKKEGRRSRRGEKIQLPLRVNPDASPSVNAGCGSPAPPWNLCCKQESASRTQKHILLRIRWPGELKGKSGVDSRTGDSQRSTTGKRLHQKNKMGVTPDGTSPKNSEPSLSC